MADTRFTALGMSGSGKTCYVLGMYYEMCVGVRGFTLTTTNGAASKLEDWMDQLDDEVGADRFPAGTALTEVTDYMFKLNYMNQSIMSFDWADYGGGTLRAREDNPGAFNSLMSSIEESTACYIFIDGELLCDEDPERRLRNVQRKCARTINTYISAFAETHDGEMPPVVFVITKADLCGRYLSQEEMIKIIRESFSSVFGGDTTSYIVAVSLGARISDDNYSGDVKPINIHLPFFIGIYHDFMNFCFYIKGKIMEAENDNRAMISASESEILYQQNRWFFTDQSKIDHARHSIQEANANIRSNQALLQHYKKLLGAVGTELAKCSGQFKMFVGGREADFNLDDIFAF